MDTNKHELNSFVFIGVHSWLSLIPVPAYSVRLFR